ncbi:MAG: cation:proton antiporter [Flammeovirgaceae bacterium]|nr:cation:proton antiporter [Flammeovirgaceae bacterium]
MGILLMEIPILTDLTIILGISVFVILILHRLKLPTIIGFLISGIICGPHTLHLINTETEVEALAEIGIVLLLFTIGLEFSLSSLMRIKKAVFVGGALQLLLTIGAFAWLAYYVSYDYWPIAVFIGFLFSVSSSAIVLKVLQNNGDIKKEYGKLVLAILIFQDIAVVPMILTAPLLMGMSEDLFLDLGILALKVAGVILFLFVSSKYIVPKLLFQITKTKSKDLFIISIFVICFAIAWLTSYSGLSLALGAFLAGLIISESRYGYEAAGIILPFKEIFTSIFFVSVGMMLDVTFLIENFFYVAMFTIITMVIKAITGGLAAAALRVSLHVVFMTAINVCQIGEFSFVLMKTGNEIGLLPIEIHQYFLAIAVLTMSITPFLMTFDKQIANFMVNHLPIPKRLKRKSSKTPEKGSGFNLVENLEDHIIIVGYGLTGQSLAHCAMASQIKFVVIELNPKTVAEAAAAGIPIVYGDADNEELLHYANLSKAKVAVITTIATNKTPEITYHLRRLNPDLSIITRTKQIKDMEELRTHGADVVIADELESKMETINMVLSQYDIPQDHIDAYSNLIRDLR